MNKQARNGRCMGVSVAIPVCMRGRGYSGRGRLLVGS